MPRLRMGMLPGATALAFGLTATPVAWHRVAWHRVAWHRVAWTKVSWISGTADGLHYEVSLLDHYDPAQHYPLLLTLHQANMGSYRRGLLMQVDAWFVGATFRSRHPAVVVLPMLDQNKDPTANFGGKRAGHSWQDAVLLAVRLVTEQYAVDPARIYVTGNLLGGMGTRDMLLCCNAQNGPKARIFAAGMPLAGRHHTADPVRSAQALRTVPIWVVHGRPDDEESLAWDRTMAGLLSASKTFHYTEAADLGHDVWSKTYARPDVRGWLFAQSSDSK